MSFALLLLYLVVLSLCGRGWVFPAITFSQPNYSYGCFMLELWLLWRCDIMLLVHAILISDCFRYQDMHDKKMLIVKDGEARLATCSMSSTKNEDEIYVNGFYLMCIY